jgi:hypothetical protein
MLFPYGRPRVRRSERPGASCRTYACVVSRVPNLSVENSRDKRPLLDTTDDPVQGHNTEEYIGMIASTSALVAASSTKRGTPPPIPPPAFSWLYSFCPLLYHTQRSALRRVNVPFAGTIFRSVYLGCITPWRVRVYKPFSTTSAISRVSLTHTLRLTHRTSAISVRNPRRIHSHWEAYAYSTAHKDTDAPSRCRPIP